MEAKLSHPQHSPPGRRERRKLEVRSRIADAARKLFAQQGFAATTVDEIAQVADVAPATFFNHFRSKQALRSLLAREVFDHLQAMTAESLGRPGPPGERLRRFVARAAEDIGRNRAAARETLLEFVRVDGTPDEPHPYLTRIFEPFEALIDEGQRSGAFRSDRDAAFLTQMAIGMLNAVLTGWLADAEDPVEEKLVSAAEFILDTLSPRP